jgi:hypothetical protein
MIIATQGLSAHSACHPLKYRRSTQKGPENATDMIRPVHVGGIETGNQQIEAPSALLQIAEMRLRDLGIGEQLAIKGA